MKNYQYEANKIFRRVLNVFKRIQQEIGTNAYAEIIFKI